MNSSKRLTRLSLAGAVTASALVATALPAVGAGDEDGRAAEAGAETAAAAAPVPALVSDNVKPLASFPDTTGISGDFSLSTEHFYVSSLDTLTVFDISDPKAPVPVGTEANFVFENEAMNYGEQRTADGLEQFIMVGVDLAQAGAKPQDPNIAEPELIIFDVSDPTNPEERSRVPATTSTHTVTCVIRSNCTYVYSAGGDGRFSIFDLRDLDNPKEVDANPDKAGIQGFRSPATAPSPVFSGGAGHKWNYVGDGIAYHTGSGGTAAFDVSRPRQPRLLTTTNAEAGTPEESTPWNNFIHHNSWQPHVFAYKPNSRPSLKNGNVLLVTEEDYEQTDCSAAGSFQTWKIGNLKSPDAITPLDRVELTDLGGPAEGIAPRDTFCSAHWFDYQQSGIVAVAYYNGGVRLLDVRDPRNIKPFGFVSGGGQTWDAYWVPKRNDQMRVTRQKSDIFYSVDAVRGLEVYKVTNMPEGSASK